MRCFLWTLVLSRCCMLSAATTKRVCSKCLNQHFTFFLSLIEILFYGLIFSSGSPIYFSGLIVYASSLFKPFVLNRKKSITRSRASTTSQFFECAVALSGFCAAPEISFLRNSYFRFFFSNASPCIYQANSLFAAQLIRRVSSMKRCSRELLLRS